MSQHVNKNSIQRLIQNIETVILGKTDEITLVLSAFLAGGHVLLEDVPGTGKTMLAKSLARSIDLDFSRIQFTPDLLPSELTGINFYSPKTGEFTFRKGSLFAHIVLADEINRATPRTQSGLLEAMEERQVSVDGTTYALGNPYFVIATQNPIETQGTFPLPEAQLDRFMVQLSLGYPSLAESVAIAQAAVSGTPLQQLQSVLSPAEFAAASQAAQQLFIHPDVYQYMAALAMESRQHPAVSLGISTRGIIGLAKLAQAFVYISGREYVMPQDVIHLLPYAFGHRMGLKGALGNRASTMATVLEDMVKAVPLPTEHFKG